MSYFGAARRPLIQLARHQAAAALGNGVVDTPTAIDLLGYDGFARAIAGRVLSLQMDETPLTIGVFGEWGSGKTSFLKMIDAALNEARLHPIWFHAWKYDQEDNLWSALIQTVVGQGTIHCGWHRRWWAKVRIRLCGFRPFAGSVEVGRALTALTARLFFIALCALVIANRNNLASLLAPILGPHTATWTTIVAALAGIVAAKPEKLLDLFSARIGVDLKTFGKVASYREHIAFLDEFTSELERIVSIAGGGRPLVVIIDDLDRCLPEKALQVLEAIKLFLDVPGVVFLLAVDREVIERAVMAKYVPTNADTSEDRLVLVSQAESFLEKLIHLPFALPPLGRDDVVHLVQGICIDPDVARLAGLFAKGLPPNPRSVKRTLQMFLFMRDLARTGGKDIRDPLLAKLIVIQERCRDLYRELYTSQEMLGEIEAIARGGQAGSGQIDAARRERIERHLARYPLLGDLLRYGADETFAGISIEPYLSLLRSVPDVKQRSDHTARQSLRDLVAARVLADRSAARFLMPLHLQDSNGEVVTLNPALPDVDVLFRRSNQVLLIGPGGSGKTTLLMMVARALLREPLIGKDIARLPLYINMGGYPFSGGSITDWIVNAAIAADRPSEPLARVELARLVLDGGCCVMLDGLDEVEQRVVVEEAIANLAAASPAIQIIVATRNAATPLKSQLTNWTLLPATEQDAAAFIEHRFGDRAGSVMEQIRENLGQLPTAPLFLESIASDLDFATSPQPRTTMVSALVDRVLARVGADPHGLSPDVARLLLRRMVGSTATRTRMSEPDALAIGRETGLTDVQTLAYLDALLNAGIIQRDNFNYSLVHDLIAAHFTSAP